MASDSATMDSVSLLLLLARWFLIWITPVVIVVTVWVIRAVSKKGVLSPRPPAIHPNTGDPQAPRGWRVPTGLATTHYAIFSRDASSVETRLSPNKRGEDPKLVVFVHGLGASLEQLTWGGDGGLQHSLVEAGYTVLAFDLYGHGFSDAPDTPLAPHEFVSQLYRLLRYLEVSEPFDLIGHSYGSYLACAYVSAYPAEIKHLVLTSPFCCRLSCLCWRPFAALGALIVHWSFLGNMSHPRTVYRMLANMEGYRLPGFLERIADADTKVFITVGELELQIWNDARSLKEALAGQSALHILPRGDYMSWAQDTNHVQRSVKDLIVYALDASQPGLKLKLEAEIWRLKT